MVKEWNCNNCGRVIPHDARICPYCGKNIEQNKITGSGPYQMQQSKQKNDDKLVIAIILIIVVLFVSIAVSATIYVYMSGMLSSSNNQLNEQTPDIIFMKNTLTNTLTVTNVDLSVTWEELKITGNCDKTGLIGYIEVGQQIINCEGTITIIYVPSSTIIGTWFFS